MKSFVFLMLAALVFVAKVYVNGEVKSTTTHSHSKYAEFEFTILYIFNYVAGGGGDTVLRVLR